MFRLRRLRLRIEEVPRDVLARSEQALFFGGPQRESNRAARLQAELLNHAHGFDHRRRSGGVVGGAGRVRIRVEVRAHDHDFVREIAAGNLRDDVERVAFGIGFRMELRLDVDFHPHRLAVLEQADEAVVVLDGQRRRRHLLRRLRIAAAAVAGEDRAAVDALRLPRQIAAAGGKIAIAAAIEHDRRAFGHEEALHELRKLLRRHGTRCTAHPVQPVSRRRLGAR